MSIWRTEEETKPWKGGYQPYDLIKEACIAVGVITLLAVLLTVLFSSPDDKPSTISQWSHEQPANFATAAATELDGTSGTAEYGPPYNHNGEGQQRLDPAPAEMARRKPSDQHGRGLRDRAAGNSARRPRAADRARRIQGRAGKAEKGMGRSVRQAARRICNRGGRRKAAAKTVTVDTSTGTVTVKATGAGPVPTMMAALTSLAKSGGLDGGLVTSSQFFQTDYTKPLLFMADGGLLEERAEAQHLLGEQWGMMNETGSYPGQPWLWLYALWYQVEPFKASENADILVMMVMGVLSLAFICIPFIPVINRIPRWIPVYKLIWHEHYRAEAGPSGGRAQSEPLAAPSVLIRPRSSA